MPRDLIDAPTYSSHLARLQADRAVAAAEYDDAALRAATNEDGKPALADARAKLQDVDASIEALKRARSLSENAELQEEEEQRAADRVSAARATLAKGESAKEKKREAQDAFRRAIEFWQEADADEREFREGLISLISGLPRAQIVADRLRHNFDGPALLGQLRAANMTMDDEELDQGALSSMLRFRDTTLEGMAKSRIDGAVSLAAVDVPELKQ